MKFCKSYENYMKQFEKTLPGIGYRRLKKNINKCRNHMKFQDEPVSPLDCSVCDGIFFPSLFDEMSAVVDCFDKEARKLLDPPLSCPWGIWRYSCFDCSGNEPKDHVLMKECQELLIYAMVNAIAFRKILKKYDKDIVFDAVALRCGHILCYMCACSAASVTIVDGLKTATPKQKCPLCREARVYGNAIRLDELNILLSKRCPEYWEKRLESERVERLRLVKEHWQSQVNGLS